MPMGTNGNPTAAVVMIAEKAAAEILTTWLAKKIPIPIPKSINATQDLDLDPEILGESQINGSESISA